MKMIHRLIFRIRFYLIGLDVALLEEQLLRVRQDLQEARRKESLLMVDALVKGLLS